MPDLAHISALWGQTLPGVRPSLFIPPKCGTGAECVLTSLEKLYKIQIEEHKNTLFWRTNHEENPIYYPGKSQRDHPGDSHSLSHLWRGRYPRQCPGSIGRLCLEQRVQGILRRESHPQPLYSQAAPRGRLLPADPAGRNPHGLLCNPGLHGVLFP